MTELDTKTVFISYNHEDSDWLEKLQLYLRPLVRMSAIDIWSDERIKAGDDWRDEIQQALAEARVAVLLVSPRFLASDFIADKELAPILAAAANGGLRIIWVLISACSFRFTEIERYQAAHNPERPLDLLSEPERSEALTSISEQILEAALAESPPVHGGVGTGAAPSTDLALASMLLKDPYPDEDEISRFPFADLLKRLWQNDPGYQDHGPKVLESMNLLLSNEPEKIVRGKATPEQIRLLRGAVSEITTHRFGSWPPEDVKAILRIAVLYHDIGKYIIKDRHPVIGWHTIQHLDPDEKAKLKELLGRDEYFDLLSLIIRDHDQFGVLNTGEASYPILLRAARSMRGAPNAAKLALSALMLFNLADMAGVFDVDGEAVEKIIGDWEWLKKTIDHCEDKQIRLDDYLLTESSRVTHTVTRIQRLIREASRHYPDRRREFQDEQFIADGLHIVFGNQAKISEFAARFTRICKLDYGKRFFDALLEYCEGPQKKQDWHILPRHAPERVDKERVLYAVLAILERITNSYASMIGNGNGHLIGIELKDLTPEAAPEKTCRIIELIIDGHYPGLAWLMSDAPAWYF